MDKKDVLKAIMNVKKYAKTLKVSHLLIQKNATTLSEIPLEDDLQTHSPSYFPCSASQLSVLFYLVNSTRKHQFYLIHNNTNQVKTLINKAFYESSIPRLKHQMQSSISQLADSHPRKEHSKKSEKSLQFNTNKHPLKQSLSLIESSKPK